MPRTGKYRPVYVDRAGNVAADIQSADHCRALISGLEKDIQSIDQAVKEQGAPITSPQRSARFYKKLALSTLLLRLPQLAA